MPDIHQLALVARGKHTLLICDDLSYIAYASKTMSLLFSNHSNKEKISVIIVTQNLYPSAKYRRTIAVNMSHFLIMREPGKFQW